MKKLVNKWMRLHVWVLACMLGGGLVLSSCDSILGDDDDDPVGNNPESVDDKPEIADRTMGLWLWRGEGASNVQSFCYLREDRTLVTGVITVLGVSAAFNSSWQIDGKSLYGWNETEERYNWVADYNAQSMTLIGFDGSTLKEFEYTQIYKAATGKATSKMPGLIGREYTGDRKGGTTTLAFLDEEKVLRTDVDGSTGAVTEQEYAWKLEDNLLRFSPDGGRTWPEEMFGVGLCTGYVHQYRYPLVLFVDLGDVYTALNGGY